jgi:hypothetical protein
LILVDSSVWIDYFKGTITAPRHLDTSAVSLPRLVTTWLRSRQTGDVVPSGDWPGCAWITGTRNDASWRSEAQRRPFLAHVR